MICYPKIEYAKGLSKGTQATQSVKWNKCTNEKMTWNTQDANLSSYVANVDHTISGQGTGISTLDQSATTPRALIQLSYHFSKFYNKCKSNESQLVQMIIMMVSSNSMSPVGPNIKNVHKGDLLYNEWLLHRNMIVGWC